MGGFRDSLGPVRGPGIRSATRLVNTLKAGWSVDQWGDFETCSHVFVSLPRKRVAASLQMLGRDPFGWRGKTLVVIDSELDTQDLGDFRAKGAHTVTVDRLAQGSRPCLALQGDSRSLRGLQRLFAGDLYRIVEIAAGQRAAFLAGVAFASSLSLPILAASADTFAATGIPAGQAQMLAEDILARTARSFLRGGKKTWCGAVAEGNVDDIEERWRGLKSANPASAALFLEVARAAARHFGKNDELARLIDQIPDRHFGRWQRLRVTGD